MVKNFLKDNYFLNKKFLIGLLLYRIYPFMTDKQNSMLNI